MRRRRKRWNALVLKRAAGSGNRPITLTEPLDTTSLRWASGHFSFLTHANPSQIESQLSHTPQTAVYTLKPAGTTFLCMIHAISALYFISLLPGAYRCCSIKLPLGCGPLLDGMG